MKHLLKAAMLVCMITLSLSTAQAKATLSSWKVYQGCFRLKTGAPTIEKRQTSQIPINGLGRSLISLHLDFLPQLQAIGTSLLPSREHIFSVRVEADAVSLHIASLNASNRTLSGSGADPGLRSRFPPPIHP